MSVPNVILEARDDWLISFNIHNGHKLRLSSDLGLHFLHEGLLNEHDLILDVLVEVLFDVVFKHGVNLNIVLIVDVILPLVLSDGVRLKIGESLICENRLLFEGTFICADLFAISDPQNVVGFTRNFIANIDRTFRDEEHFLND